MTRKQTASILLIAMFAFQLAYLYEVEAEPIGWSYKRTLTLNPATPIANYQIMIELNTTNFDYSKADSEGDDIRFYNTSGSELSYWTELWNTTGTSTIWIKVPTSGTDAIYMYYGNPYASSESNADNVFLFFDDFNDGVYTDKWDVSGTLSESGGTLNLYPGSYATSKPIINGQSLIIEDRKQRLFPYEAYSGLYSTTTNDYVRNTDSSYTGEGGYYDGNRLDHGGTNFGGFALGSDPSSTDMLIYQMIIDGTSVSLMRGASLDTLGQHISSTLNTNFDSFDYKVRLHVSTYVSGIGGKYDWIRIRRYASIEPTTTVGDETWIYDVTGDDYCGIDDLVAIAVHFGTSLGHPDWNPIYDMNGNGYITIDDIVLMVENFGRSA